MQLLKITTLTRALSTSVYHRCSEYNTIVNVEHRQSLHGQLISYSPSQKRMWLQGDSSGAPPFSMWCLVLLYIRGYRESWGSMHKWIQKASYWFSECPWQKKTGPDLLSAQREMSDVKSTTEIRWIIQDADQSHRLFHHVPAIFYIIAKQRINWCRK